MRALFIGRFQPFHKGHMEAIKEIMKNSDEITILIAGPGKPDKKNPFSFEEREEMIKKTLEKHGIKHEIRRIKDVNDDIRWGEEIKRLGEFDSVYSRNPWTVRCLKKAGFEVKRHEFHERYKNCGRVIRGRVSKGKEWKDLVPREVYEYLKGIDGEERIRNS